MAVDFLCTVLIFTRQLIFRVAVGEMHGTYMFFQIFRHKYMLLEKIVTAFVVVGNEEQQERY